MSNYINITSRTPRSDTTSIAVLLADDHPVVRSGIRSELERHAAINVVGEAVDGNEALRLAETLQPDLILLDISMPGLSGIEVANKLNEMSSSGTKLPNWPPLVLGLSAHCDKEYVYSLFAAGAKGYLLKDEPPHRIVEGVLNVMRGMPALSLPVQTVLLSRRSTPNHGLTPREAEVLQLMAKGYTNEEIAQFFVIAEGTVKNHVTNIYKKLPGARTRAEAVAWAWENGLVNNKEQ